MDKEYFKFSPGTHTCRAPLPTTFKHLLGFATKIEQYLTIHNQEEIININEVLEQTLNLQISNIIQRVIAQVIGETPTGFITIKGTNEGALHVHVTGSERIGEEVSWMPIDFNTIGLQTVIPLAAGVTAYISSIVFTVEGEVDLTFKSSDTAITGAMSFGGTNEPRGIVINHGMHPFHCKVGEAFCIYSDSAVQVSGYCTYYKK